MFTWDDKWLCEAYGQQDYMEHWFGTHKVSIRRHETKEWRTGVVTGNWVAAFSALTEYPFFADDWYEALPKGCALLRKGLTEFLEAFEDDSRLRFRVCTFENAEKMKVFSTTGVERVYTHNFEI